MKKCMASVFADQHFGDASPRLYRQTHIILNVKCHRSLHASCTRQHFKHTGGLIERSTRLCQSQNEMLAGDKTFIFSPWQICTGVARGSVPNNAHEKNKTIGPPPPDLLLLLRETVTVVHVKQSTPALTHEQRRSSRQALGAKPSTAGGKSRSGGGDGSKGRALQRTWTRPEALAANDGVRGGEPIRSSASSHETTLGIDQQAAALRLYA